MAMNLDIPRWRKVAFFVCFFSTLALGGLLANREADFYVSGARSPRPATGETYAISVNHGAVRYLRAREYETYQAWKAHFSLPMLVGILVLATSRDFWRSVREADS